MESPKLPELKCSDCGSTTPWWRWSARKHAAFLSRDGYTACDTGGCFGRMLPVQPPVQHELTAVLPTPTIPTVAGRPLTILEEAATLVESGGDRNDSYDHPRHNFEKIAAKWSVTFGFPVTPRQVALAMIDVKTVRDGHSPKRDNLVDIAGYARCAERLDEAVELTF